MKQICRPGAKFDMGWLFQTILNIHGNRVRDYFALHYLHDISNEGLDRNHWAGHDEKVK